MYLWFTGFHCQDESKENKLLLGNVYIDNIILLGTITILVVTSVLIGSFVNNVFVGFFLMSTMTAGS